MDSDLRDGPSPEAKAYLKRLDAMTSHYGLDRLPSVDRRSGVLVRNSGSHMYHSHHNATDQVGRGLLGAFIVDPKDPAQRPDKMYGVTQDIVWISNDSLGGFTINGRGFPATKPLAAKLGERIYVRFMNEGVMMHPWHLHGLDMQVVARDGHPLSTRSMVPPWRGRLKRERKGAAKTVDATRSLAEDEAQLAQLARDFAERRISRLEWLAARDAIEHRLDELRGRLAAERRVGSVASYAERRALSGACGRRFTLDQQRAIVSAVLDHARVGPAVKGRNVFDPGRRYGLAVLWRSVERALT